MGAYRRSLIVEDSKNVSASGECITFEVQLHYLDKNQTKLPLVLFSHGHGGSSELYPTITNYLAEQGFIVAAVEHFGNNRKNGSLNNSDENLVLRPRHLSLTIDAVLKDSEIGGRIDWENIFGVGHSLGGYSLVALAGGQPWTITGKKLKVESDPRMKGMVLLAPGVGWFNAPHALDAVKLPILVLHAEHDLITPFWNTEILLNRVPDKGRVRARTVPGAGHFSFLSPFPAHLKVPGFLPATDPVGFDREAFHQTLPQEIEQYLLGLMKI